MYNAILTWQLQFDSYGTVYAIYQIHPPVLYFMWLFSKKLGDRFSCPLKQLCAIVWTWGGISPTESNQVIMWTNSGRLGEVRCYELLYTLYCLAVADIQWDIFKKESDGKVVFVCQDIEQCTVCGVHDWTRIIPLVLGYGTTKILELETRWCTLFVEGIHKL